MPPLGTSQRIITNYVDAQGLRYTVNSLGQDLIQGTEFIDPGASAFDSLVTALTPAITTQLYINSTLPPLNTSNPVIPGITHSPTGARAQDELDGDLTDYVQACAELASEEVIAGFGDISFLRIGLSLCGIDTTKPGLYPVTFSVTTIQGFRATVVRTVVVVIIACSFAAHTTPISPAADVEGCNSSGFGTMSGDALMDSMFVIPAPPQPTISLIKTSSRGALVEIEKVLACPPDGCWLYGCRGYEYAEVGLAPCDLSTAIAQAEIGETLSVRFVVYGDGWPPVAESVERILVVVDGCSTLEIYLCDGVCSESMGDPWPQVYNRVFVPLDDLPSASRRLQDLSIRSSTSSISGQDSGPGALQDLSRLTSSSRTSSISGQDSGPKAHRDPRTVGSPGPRVQGRRLLQGEATVGYPRGIVAELLATIYVAYGQPLPVALDQCSSAELQQDSNGEDISTSLMAPTVKAFVDPLRPVDPDRFIPPCNPFSISDGTCLPGTYNLIFSVWDKDMRGASAYQLAVVEGRIEVELWVQIPHACDSSTGPADSRIASEASSLPSLQQLRGSLPSNQSFLEDFVFVVLPTLGLDPLAVRWGQLTAVSVESMLTDTTICLVNASLVMELGCVPDISISSDTVIQHCPCPVLSTPSGGGGLARASAAIACMSTSPQVEKGDLISSEVVALVQNSAILNLQIKVFLDSLTDSIGKLDDFAEQFADLLAHQRMVAVMVMKEASQAALLCKQFGSECDGELTFSALSDQLGGNIPTSFAAALTSLFQGDPEASSCSNQRLPQAMFSFVIPSLEGNASTSDAGRHRRLGATNTWAGYNMDAVKELVERGYSDFIPEGLAPEDIPPRRVVGASSNQIIGGLFLHQTRRAMDSSAEFATDPWGTCSSSARFAKAYTTACQVKDAEEGDGLEKGTMRGRGVDPTMQPKSSIFHKGAYDQPGQWYNMTTPNPLVSNYGTVWGFEMIPLTGLPDGFPFVMTVGVKESRFKQMLAYLKDGRYLDSKDISSLKMQVATFNPEIRAYGLFQAMVNWGVNGAITAKFTSVSMIYHSFITADKESNTANFAFACDVLVILVIAAFSMFWLLEASHIITIWWKVAMIKLKPESGTATNGGDINPDSDRALSGWGNPPSQKALDPLKGIQGTLSGWVNLTSLKALDPLKDSGIKGTSNMVTATKGSSAHTAEVDVSSPNTGMTCSAYANVVDGSAHATEVDGSALDTGMTCSAYATEVDCSAHASELESSSHTTELGTSGGSSSPSDDSHNPSLRSCGQAVGEGIQSNDVLPFRMSLGRQNSAASLGHGVAEVVESEVKPGGLSRPLLGMMSRGRQKSAASRGLGVAEVVESEVKPGGLSRPLLGMMSRGRQKSAASCGHTIAEGVESEVKPGGLSRSLLDMMSFGKSFRSTPEDLSGTLDAMRKQPLNQRSLSPIYTNQGASSVRSTDITLTDSTQDAGSSLSRAKALPDSSQGAIIPPSNDKDLPDVVTEPDFSPNLSVDKSKVTWFIYDLCIILFMIGALTMLMLYLAHFKSDNLPTEGTFDVYDGVQFSPSHYLMLKRKVDATADLLSGAEDAPLPGQPLRWKLPEDRSGMEELNAMYQYLEKASNTWLVYTLLQCIILLLLLVRVISLLVFYPTLAIIPFTLIQAAPDLLHLALALVDLDTSVYTATSSIDLDKSSDVHYQSIVDLDKSVYVTTSSIVVVDAGDLFQSCYLYLKKQSSPSPLRITGPGQIRDLEKSVYVTTSSIAVVDAQDLFQSCYLYLKHSSSTAARYTVPTVAYAGCLFLVVIANSFILAILSMVFKVLKAVHWRLQSLFYGAPSNDRIYQMIGGIFAGQARKKFRAGISSILALRKLSALTLNIGGHQGRGEPIDGLGAAHPHQSSDPVGGSGGESGQGDMTSKEAAIPGDDSRLGKSKALLTPASLGRVKRNSREKELDPQEGEDEDVFDLPERLIPWASTTQVSKPAAQASFGSRPQLLNTVSSKLLGCNLSKLTSHIRESNMQDPLRAMSSSKSFGLSQSRVHASMAFQKAIEARGGGGPDPAQIPLPSSEITAEIKGGNKRLRHAFQMVSHFSTGGKSATTGRSLKKLNHLAASKQEQPSPQPYLESPITSPVIPIRSFLLTSMDEDSVTDIHQSGSQIPPDQRLRQGQGCNSFLDENQGPGSASLQDRIQTQNPRSASCRRQSLSQGSRYGSFRNESLSQAPGSASFRGQSLCQGPGSASLQNQSLSQDPLSGSFQNQSLSQGPGAASLQNQSLRQDPGSASFLGQSLSPGPRFGSFRNQSLSQAPGSKNLQNRIPSQGPGSASPRGNAELLDDEVNPPRGAVLVHTNSLQSGHSMLGGKTGVDQGSGSMWNSSQRNRNESFYTSSHRSDQTPLLPTQTGNSSTLESLRGSRAVPSSDSMCTSSATTPTQHPVSIMSPPSRLKIRTIPQEPEPDEWPYMSAVDIDIDEDDTESASALNARQDTLGGILRGLATQQMRRADNRLAWSQRPKRSKSYASLLDSRSDSVTAFSSKDGDASTDPSGIPPQGSSMVVTASSRRMLSIRKTAQQVASLGRLPSMVSKTRQLPRQNNFSLGGNPFLRRATSKSQAQLPADAIITTFNTGEGASSPQQFNTGEGASMPQQYNGTVEDELPIKVMRSLLKNPLRAGSPQDQATPAHLTENFELATHKSMSSGHRMPSTPSNNCDSTSHPTTGRSQLKGVSFQCRAWNGMAGTSSNDRGSRPSTGRPQVRGGSFQCRAWNVMAGTSSNGRDRGSRPSLGRPQLGGVSFQVGGPSLDERSSVVRSSVVFSATPPRGSRGTRTAGRMSQLTDIGQVKDYEDFLSTNQPQPTSANQIKAVSSVVELTTSAIELMQDLQAARHSLSAMATQIEFLVHEKYDIKAGPSKGELHPFQAGPSHNKAMRPF
eukprot:gene26430-17531_t